MHAGAGRCARQRAGRSCLPGRPVGGPVDLPADPAIAETQTLSLLQGTLGNTFAADGPSFLSQLLFYSAAISSSKLAPATGNKYALRVNPSSGNLHPTEFHFVTRGLRQWPDGLYHYRPSSHMAEQRATGAVQGEVDGAELIGADVLATRARERAGLSGNGRLNAAW